VFSKNKLLIAKKSILTLQLLIQLSIFRPRLCGCGKKRN